MSLSLMIFLLFILAINIHALITMRKIKLKNWTYRKLSVQDYKLIYAKILELDGREFEEFIAFLFEKLNFKVELTQATNDKGKDLILNDSTYVECKAYAEENYIGRPAIQKLVGACVGDGIAKAIFITTSQYNKNVYEYTKSLKFISLELWDMVEIMSMVEQIDTSEILHWLGYSKDTYAKEYIC